MQTRMTTTLAAVAVLAMLSGWMIGGGAEVAAQGVVPPPPPPAPTSGEERLEGYEWRMFGGNVAGTGGSGGSDLLTGSAGHGVHGGAWLYNSRTGKVYRVFNQYGGEDGANGCLLALPVFSADRLGDYLPNPATDGDPPGYER